jgi:nucleotide-binding universal stress UspA family protein
MYKHILVPLDGSQLAERILPHVQAIAKGTGAEVLLLRVVSVPTLGVVTVASPAEAKKWVETEQAAAANYLEGVAKRLKDVGIPAKIAVLLDGDPAVEIITMAEKQGVDLIAMMSHGETGFSKFEHGSVTEKVLRHSTRPVLMARAFRRHVRLLHETEAWSIKD